MPIEQLKGDIQEANEHVNLHLGEEVRAEDRDLRHIDLFKATWMDSTTLEEFLLWLTRLRTQLISLRMQIQSLALLSGLRIQHSCELWYRLQMQLGS